MKINTPATRNTCFAIISSIEDDLRTFIRNECRALNISDVLPVDVRESAVKRWRIDNQSSGQEYADNDLDLLNYVDFMDIKKIIDKSLYPANRINDVDVKSLTATFEELHPIRNRVCHTRPLESEDLSKCVDTANELLRFRGITFSSLTQTIKTLEENPAHALQLQIPTFWSLDNNDVNHNLPLAEFDETGFIGRIDNRREVIKLLKTKRNIINIIGEGGVGKTALALRCLYDILDDPERPFDVIVWVSLKTQTLTTNGIAEIRDAIADTLGLLRSVATSLGTAEISNLSAEELIEEITQYLATTNVLVAIDNLETLAGDQILRSLLLEVPNNSKILFTSRVGLGELELPYTLNPLNLKEANALMMRFATILSQDVIRKAKEPLLNECCKALFNNPLLIKWFVESIAHGLDPNTLLSHNNTGKFQKALDFCCSSLLSKLNDAEKKLVDILVAARSPLTRIQLSHFYSTMEPQITSDFDYALGLLHNSCLVKREAGYQGDYRYRLSDPVEAYISANYPPKNEIFKDMQRKLQDLRKQAEDATVKQATYKFDVFSIRVNNHDEQIIATHLSRALREVNPHMGNADINAAREHLEHAKSLFPSHAETYRVEGLVESVAGQHHHAAQAFAKAVDYEPNSPLIRYTYAQFLIRELEQFDEALLHLQ